MFRAIPTGSKICFDNDLKRNWKIHEHKMRHTKSSLSQVKPEKFNFLDIRAKKAALDEIRNIEIQKENNSLLYKIKSIAHKSNKTSVGTSIDRQQKKKSLNQPFRKRELGKIVQENQSMLKRIQTKKSNYNVRKWQQQRKEVEKNITLISQFPFKDYPSTRTHVNLWMTSENFNKNSRVLHHSQINSPRKTNNLVFSATQKINGAYYLVQTYLNKRQFNLQVQNLQDSNEKYRLTMNEDQIIQLLSNKFRGELRNLLNTLQIDRENGVCSLNDSQSPTLHSRNK